MRHDAVVLSRSEGTVQALQSERPEPEYLEGILSRVLPAITATGRRHQGVEVTDHALREFRIKFPRYASRLGDGQLMEDLRIFVETSCWAGEREGKEALICHVPIWDKMEIITRPLATDALRIITVSRREKDLETDGSRRAAYGIVLAQQILTMSWFEMCARLQRFEHDSGRHGWGLILVRPGTDRPLGTYLTTHELLDFWAYRNYLGVTLLGRRLTHIAERLKLPVCSGAERSLASIREGTASHGLYVDPPAPHVLALEMMNALLRRLYMEER